MTKCLKHEVKPISFVLRHLSDSLFGFDPSNAPSPRPSPGRRGEGDGKSAEIAPQIIAYDRELAEVGNDEVGPDADQAVALPRVGFAATTGFVAGDGDR